MALHRIRSVIAAFLMLLGVVVVVQVAPALTAPASAAVIGDDYPTNLRNAPQDSIFPDPWRFYNRECTSFVAWRLNSQNKVAFTDYYGGPQWGDASTWGPTARKLGIPVDNSPAVGSVAWESGGDHVAWVAAVGNGTVTIEEYNYDYHGHYNTRTVAASAFQYIHIHDLSGEGSSVGGYESAFQANTHSLHLQGDILNADAQQGMAAGTSPGVAVLSSGGYEAAFQANTGNMFVYGDAGGGDTHQGMAAGTSPSIAASPGGGFEAAFQANTGDMYTYSSVSGSADRQVGMAAGTSPAIAALPGGGYEMAFQANTGNLWVYGDAGSGDTHQGMKAGTSPSIASSRSGGFEVAFQANTGSLFTYSSTGGAADRQQGMDNGTSPAIAALPGSGYEMAFQANTGYLFVYGDAGGGGDTHEGMMSGTSPAIAASPSGGFEVVFQANTGSMFWYRSTTGPADLQQGMDTATSPCVSSALGGGCPPSALPPAPTPPPPPTASPSRITTSALPTGVVGKPFAATLQAAGGRDRYTWSLASGRLPAGLNITAAGRIAGTPSRPGTMTFTVRITHTGTPSWSSSRVLRLTIAAVAIRTTALPGAHLNHTYSATLSAYGAGTKTWSLASGKLPKGLRLSASGRITGTPLARGRFTVTLRVSTANKASAAHPFGLTVA